MKYENVASAVAKMKENEERLAALGHASSMIYFDATTRAPSDTAEGRGRTLGIISALEYEIISNPENAELIAYLEQYGDSLTDEERAIIELYIQIV